MSTLLRPSTRRIVQLARLSSLRSSPSPAHRLARLPKPHTPLSSRHNHHHNHHHFRFYSSEPPRKPESDQPESANKDTGKDGDKGVDAKDGVTPEEAHKEPGEGAQPQNGKASASSPTEDARPLPPLPPGWVRLSEEELRQMSHMLRLVPESKQGAVADVLQDIKRTGGPPELRDLLARQKDDKSFSVTDMMKGVRIAYKLADRMAKIQAADGKEPPSFDSNAPNQQQEREKMNSSQDQQPQGQEGEQQKSGKEASGKEGSHEEGSSKEEGSKKESSKEEDGKQRQGGGDGGPRPRVLDLSEAVTYVFGAALLYPFYKLIFPGETSREITWEELRKNFLDKGLVEKLVVLKDRVRVELNREATQAMYPDSAGANANFYYYFSIGPVESFERKLDEAQNQLGIPPSERIPVSYAREGVLTGAILAFGPTLLLVGILVFMSRRARGGGAGASGVFGFGKSRAKMFNHETAVKVKFSDVAGMDEAKVEIMEFVSFLKSPERFQRLGAKIPRGAILSGPPGTGKTLLAKATAGESQVPFYSVSGSEFVEMFVGVGASRVRDLFTTARKNSPCIVFIDEIDAIGKSRGEGNKFGGNDEREATLNQILTEMDGFNTTEQVVVLAGTNRPDTLDKALMRPGRFDRHIHIDRPTMKGREDIFRVHLGKIVTNEDMDYLTGRLAALTPGFAGADIANAVNEAALIAARANAQSVEMIHFEQAIERVIGGLERKSLVLSPEEKKTVAYHEAGHAICGWYFRWADPLLKVSIIPRGQGALGYAQYLPSGDAYLMGTNQLMDRMAMTLGGRVSEELHFETVTTGASDDFKKVTQIATTMVTQWGMSEKLGPLHFQNDQNQLQKPFAESTAQTIDAEVRRIVDDAYRQCKDLLSSRRPEIALVAEELLSKEVLTRDDLVRLLGPRPFPDNDEFSKFFDNSRTGGPKPGVAPPPPPSEKPPNPPPDAQPALYRRPALPNDATS